MKTTICIDVFLGLIISLFSFWVIDPIFVIESEDFYVLAYNYLFTQLALHLQFDAGKFATADLGQQILQLSRPLQGGMLREHEGIFDC